VYKISLELDPDLVVKFPDPAKRSESATLHTVLGDLKNTHHSA
jgi:hypothetical protein